MSFAAQAAPVTSGTVLTVGDLIFSNFTCVANSVGDAGGSCGGLSAFTGRGGTAPTQDILISCQVASASAAFGLALRSLAVQGHQREEPKWERPKWERPELTAPAFLFGVRRRGPGQAGPLRGLAEPEETQARNDDDDRADDVDNAVHRTSLLGCGTVNVRQAQRLRRQRLILKPMRRHSRRRWLARCRPRWTSRPPRPTNAG